jgi:hypothetical protein
MPGLSSCPPSPLPPLSPVQSPGPGPRPAAAGSTAVVPALSLGPSAAAAPGFGALLAASLRCESRNKAWFDETGGGYAWVLQKRVPLKLPKVG